MVPRPLERFLSVEREVAPGTCPECGAEALRRYPVVSEGGWLRVTKCQSCLCSVEREQWNRGLGPFTFLVDQLT